MYRRLPLTTCLVLLMAAVASRGANPPAIEPKADEVLRKMSDYLASKPQIGFTVHDMLDHVAPDGQRISLSKQSKVKVRRPNRIAADVVGDVVNLAVGYDGKTFTLLSHETGEYAQVAVPDAIDKTLGVLAGDYGLVMASADLVLSDPYKAMTSNVRSGKHVGLHRVRGIPAHHLAFRQEMVDWQIWIADGDSPLPLKVVITYKEQPGDPQYIAFYDNWDMTAAYDDAAFEVVLPPNATRGNFIPTGVPQAFVPRTSRAPSTESPFNPGISGGSIRYAASVIGREPGNFAAPSLAPVNASPAGSAGFQPSVLPWASGGSVTFTQ